MLNNIDLKNNPVRGKYQKISFTWWNRIKRDAIERCLQFDISIVYAWDLFLKQNRKCALSGIELKMPEFARDLSSTASFDRINSDVGYIEENCQWVHKKNK